MRRRERAEEQAVGMTARKARGGVETTATSGGIRVGALAGGSELLSVSICTPLGTIFQAEASSLEIHSHEGVWQVTPGGNAFLTISELSRVVIQSEERETIFTISGVMKISGNKITLLSELPIAK